MASTSKLESNQPISSIPTVSNATCQNRTFNATIPRPPFIPRHPNTLWQSGKGNIGFVNSIMKGVPIPRFIPQANVRQEKPPGELSSRFQVNTPISYTPGMYSQAIIGSNGRYSQRPSDKSNLDQGGERHQIQGNTSGPPVQQDFKTPQHTKPTQDIDQLALNPSEPRTFSEPSHAHPSMDTRQYEDVSGPTSHAFQAYDKPHHMFQRRFNSHSNDGIAGVFKEVQDHRAPTMVNDYCTPPPHEVYYPFENRCEENNRLLLNSVPMPDTDRSHPVLPLAKKVPVSQEKCFKRVLLCPNLPYEIHVDIQLSDERDPCNPCRSENPELTCTRQEIRPHDQDDDANVRQRNSPQMFSNQPVEFKTQDGDIVRVMVRKSNEASSPTSEMSHDLRTRGRPNASKCVLCKVNDAIGKLPISQPSSTFPSQNDSLPEQINENRRVTDQTTATPSAQDLLSSNQRMRGVAVDSAQQVGEHASDPQLLQNQSSIFQTEKTTKNASVQVNLENQFWQTASSQPSVKSSTKDFSTQVDLQDLSHRMLSRVPFEAARMSSATQVDHRDLPSSHMLTQMLAQMLSYVDIRELFSKMVSTNGQASNIISDPHEGLPSKVPSTPKNDVMTQVGVGDLPPMPNSLPAKGSGPDLASQNALGDWKNPPRTNIPVNIQSTSNPALLAALAKLNSADFASQVHSRDIAKSNRQITNPNSVSSTEDNFPMHLSVNDKSIILPREMVTNSNGTSSQLPAAKAVVNLHIPESLRVVSAHENEPSLISTDNAKAQLPTLESNRTTAQAQDKDAKTTVLASKTSGLLNYPVANATVNLHVMARDKEFDRTTEMTWHRETATEQDQ